jgi:hypothetical protein
MRQRLLACTQVPGARQLPSAFPDVLSNRIPVVPAIAPIAAIAQFLTELVGGIVLSGGVRGSV